MIELDLKNLSLSKLEKKGDVPEARSNHSSVIYTRSNDTTVMIIYGGSGVLDDFDITYTFDIKSKEWSRLMTEGSDPGRRSYHSANIVNNYMVIFGGESHSNLTNDLYVLCLISNKW